MDFQIRECEMTDVKAICELNAREMGYAYPEDKTDDKLRKAIRIKFLLL